MAEQLSDDNALDGSEPSISRQGIEVIIRRAIDLSLSQQANSEEISESELIKIAGELGLSARHVRQAIYERSPQPQPEPGLLDRYFGPINVVAVRAIACDAPLAQRRLEDYLVTSEYLQVRRRQGSNAAFEPAEDAFSSLARAFSASGRSHLARAQRAWLSVRPLETEWCHVRLELSYAEKRRSSVIGAVFVSTIFGGVTGVMVATGLILAVSDSTMQAPIAFAGGLASATALFSTTWIAFRNGYRRWLTRSREEAEGVLDRLEHGEDLRPPASPWLRRLQQRLRGFGARPTG